MMGFIVNFADNNFKTKLIMTQNVLKKTLSLTLKLCLVVLFVLPLQGCFSSKPKGFVVATDGGTWTSIYIREGLSYDRAFGEVLDVVASRFEMDMINKDGGYGRTNWVYTWNKKGKHDDKYRTRVIFKFSADKTKVNIKTEAEYGGDGCWIKGFDTRLLSTMKQDIMGAVSRTTI